MAKNTVKKSKVHILDVIIIALFVVILFTAYGRLSGNEIISFGGSKSVQITYSILTYDYRDEYFTNIKVGDQLAEDKTYMEGTITDIQILPSKKFFVDNQGNPLEADHPFYKQALVTIEATATMKDAITKFGKQEIREGMAYFLITEKANLSSTIVDMEIR